MILLEIINNIYLLILNNYPIEQFDPATTIGLKLVADRQQNQDINHLYQYCYAYIETFLAVMDRTHIDKGNTIVIKTADYGLATFNISQEEKEKLMCQGKEAVQQYFIK